ncbi:hypothetical protein [Niabella aquatica]
MRSLFITIGLLFFLNYVYAQVDTAFFLKCGWLNISMAGTKDWAVWGNGRQNFPAGTKASEYKNGGRGIGKKLHISGNVQLGNDPGYERIIWNNGTIHKTGGALDTSCLGLHGLVADIGSDGTITLFFEAGPDLKVARASVFFWSAAAGIACIKNKNQRTEVQFPAASGALQVVFNANDPLEIEIKPKKGHILQLKSLAATLSENKTWWIRDNRLAMLYEPLKVSRILKSGRKQKKIDYLQMAINYAETMLLYGRDRYGEIHSPLFSNILTREAHPKSTPYPLFAPTFQKPEGTGSLSLGKPSGVAAENPYNAFNYNLILNYPFGLGKEGPHKVTLYGCDPMEDKALYELLADLSGISGNIKYKQAADEAITYWFTNTQSASGLYPWGEHMGWDLLNDCPVYFKGASQYFFEANYHEVRDFVPFLGTLSQIKPSSADEISLLGKYAVGIWKAHFWNKEKAYYNRHGDYNGIVSQEGELGAFPAHLAFYMRVWCAAYLQSNDITFKNMLAEYFRAVMRMALDRCEKYGFYPFDLSVDLKSKDPGKEVPLQSIRLAHHCVWLATQLEKYVPDVAQNLRQFARYHLGEQAENATLRNLEWAERLDDMDFIEGKKKAGEIPPPQGLKDMSDELLSEEFAKEILLNIQYARETGDDEYLRVAGKYGEIAALVFFKGKSPLPSAFVNGVRCETAIGQEFPDFYFNGSKLMKAFASLGVALRTKTIAKK